MKIVTVSEVQDNVMYYLEMAEKERVVIKNGEKFVHLVVTDEPNEQDEPDEICAPESWVKEFFSIPEEYRCDPFEVSPSGDIFWADKRNVEQLDGIKRPTEAANCRRLKKEDIRKFLELE
jgi:hypothetical protein